MNRNSILSSFETYIDRQNKIRILVFNTVLVDECPAIIETAENMKKYTIKLRMKNIRSVWLSFLDPSLIYNEIWEACRDKFKEKDILTLATIHIQKSS